jgi:hypothetical protein
MRLATIVEYYHDNRGIPHGITARLVEHSAKIPEILEELENCLTLELARAEAIKEIGRGYDWK